MSLERRGLLLILLSALFLAVATVVAKLMVESYDASALSVTFCRFAIGLLVALPGVITGTTPLKPVTRGSWRGGR